MVTRSEATTYLTSVVCALITTKIRGIRSEVTVPDVVGLARESVINCDNLQTVPIHDLDSKPVGALNAQTLHHLDLALTYALGLNAA